MANDEQRHFATEVVRTLRDAGHEALWAGGCVRDALLGVEPKDYDVATAAEPERVREVFGRKRTIPVGAAFGVITVLGPKRADPIEVATFRTDGGYSDGRRPDAVRFSTAEEDASRRDFTINGLFYDPLEERVIDYVGGEADLGRRLVRAIGDPDERFAEDRLRMLRAVRFASTLGFTIAADTMEAIRRHADQITVVSGERIGAELKRMLTGPSPAEAVRLLAEAGLVSQVLRGVSAQMAIDRLARLDRPSAELALAAACVGELPADASAKLARQLKWTAKEAAATGWLVEHEPQLAGAASGPWSELQPLLADARGPDLVRLYATSAATDPTIVAACEQRLALPPEELDPPPLVVGADLIAAGLQPGPRFAELLRTARAAQLDGGATTKRAALGLLGLG